LLMQIQADLLGIPVVRPANLEATALGVTRLAAVGAGLAVPSNEAGSGTGNRVFDPIDFEGSAGHQYERWKRAVERAGAWE
jgi:glycerol kinase